MKLGRRAEFEKILPIQKVTLMSIVWWKKKIMLRTKWNEYWIKYSWQNYEVLIGTFPLFTSSIEEGISSRKSAFISSKVGDRSFSFLSSTSSSSSVA